MTIFVGNISDRTTEEKLLTLFSKHGDVASAKIIGFADNKPVKRFALVRMEQLDASVAAIEALHKTYFMGNTLIVREFTPENPTDDDSAGTYNSQNGGYIRRF